MSLQRLEGGCDRMFHAASHVLGVRVAPERPMRIRRNRILAERGTITYRHEGDDLDDELRQLVERKGLRRAARDKKFRDMAAKRVDVDVAGGIVLTGNLKAHRGSGDGEVWLGYQGGDVSILEIVDDSVVVLSQQEVLAFDDDLSVTLEETIPLQLAAVRDTTFAWVVRGTGLIATATPGQTVVLKVTEDAPLRVEAEAVLAFTAGVEFAAPADYNRRATLRGVKWLLQFIPRVNIKPGRERVWMTASGEGTVVIRSSD
ncbi:AIM24 family protein [Phytoactinopolyspora limicola]|uniref:AIM24 family protein n=1 Tax=Phytoactinopolyspora limicola TaxID=2715536 RepID=UPI00140BDA0B|nr:AIM24 family protein [Phytoactinopolyspora limicola]